MPSSARYSVILGAVALLSAACDGNGPGSTGSAPPATTPAAVSAAPSTTSAAATAMPTDGPGPCATGQLSVVQQDQGVGAGQYYAAVVFTNTSNTPCNLTGYPGVSYVTDGGDQSGNAADRAPGTVTTVTIPPGAKASSLLHDTNGMGGYDPQQCQLSPAAGLRVYPPDQRDSIFVPWKTNHCAGPDIHSFTIGPIQPGATPSR
ncbi:DUF4232 domain-containing protein [Nocardia pseudobrasiliensis]|uniref:Uncharacterized protein DUF4232 n=1 Tax=Nocardia pseudobrasiliensis TaxID=45979 RepID=A0A370I533_9NOCA|nr:DUF4232 domain-containing protein [Nocardia pseudobrasiliensis]RDI64444.1 uncharacterized protein DUF4232 [Nocardia pseudobrasiliensis]